MSKIIRSTLSTTYKQGDHNIISTVTIESEYNDFRLGVMRDEIACEIADAIRKGDNQHVKEFTLSVCDLDTYSTEIIVHTTIGGTNNER